MKVNGKIVEALEENYTKASLSKSYLPFVRKVLSSVSLPANLKELVEKKNPNKQEIVSLAAIVLSSEELFLAMFNMLPSDLRHFLESMLWEDAYLHEEWVKDHYGIDIIKETGVGYGKTREVKPAFHIFSVDEKYDWRSGTTFFIGLPRALRQVWSEYFPKPEGYYLQPVKEMADKFRRFNGEEAIFQELPRVLAYASQGNIKLTNSGLPALSTFNKMRKTLALKEFYEGFPKPYDAMRSALMATLVANYGSFSVDADPLKTIENLFHFIKTYFFPLHLLNYLKGLAYVEDYYKRPVGAELVSILTEFPEEEEWVSIENVRKYAGFRSLNLQPADEYALNSYVYFPVKDYGFTDKLSVTYRYNELVKIPLLKAGFWLFAAFGLVEVAYAEPETGDKDPEGELKFTTPYDPLRYARLTSLGKYLIGRTKEYKLPDAAEKTAIRLLDDGLHIISDKPDETLDLLLNNYTVKTAPSRYRTDFKIFMKGVRNGDELDDKIRLFRQTVTGELPPNWDAFFETLRLKCDPLKSIGEHTAYQLSPQDQELMNLVARDPVLKKLAIKAEGLIIIVMKKDQSKFKSRLKEFGYLLE